jgi:hypothetical protein
MNPRKWGSPGKLGAVVPWKKKKERFHTSEYWQSWFCVYCCYYFRLLRTEISVSVWNVNLYQAHAISILTVLALQVWYETGHYLHNASLINGRGQVWRIMCLCWQHFSEIFPVLMPLNNNGQTRSLRDALRFSVTSLRIGKTFIGLVLKGIFLSKWRYNQIDAASDLLIINQFSTCFGRIYAHLQEVELPYTAYGF